LIESEVGWLARVRVFARLRLSARCPRRKGAVEVNTLLPLEGSLMPWLTRSRWIVLAGVLAFAGLAFPAALFGQEATPVPDEERSYSIHPRGTPVSAFDPMPCPLWPPLVQGISAWEIGAFLQWPSIIMVEYAPGASREGDDGTLGAQLVALTYIHSGTLTVTAEAPMAVYRWKSGQNPEIIAEGQEFVATAGDYFLTGPETPAMRNDGDVPATYQYAVIDPEDPLVIDPCAPMG
jgi:hypothetical protein